MGRSITHGLVGALQALPGFSQRSSDELLEVVAASAVLVWRAGAIVADGGRDHDATYVVLEGELVVLDGDGRLVSRLGPGDHARLAELTRRSGSGVRVEATEDAELLVVPADLAS